jgi:hypothetical protein
MGLGEGVCPFWKTMGSQSNHDIKYDNQTHNAAINRWFDMVFIYRIDNIDIEIVFFVYGIEWN